VHGLAVLTGWADGNWIDFLAWELPLPGASEATKQSDLPAVFNRRIRDETRVNDRSAASAATDAGGRVRPGHDRVCLVDSHVHFHRCFDPTRFLSAALANLRAAAAESGVPGPVAGFLMLTESAGESAFRRLRSGALVPDQPWKLRPTGEERSLVAESDAPDAVTLVAGRQIVTRDRLEVLALGTLDELPDGLPFAETVARVKESGAVAVIPWGFGKWWFRRGRLVGELVRASRGETLFLGDNGGRLRYAPRPRLFEEAARHGVYVLPGSDPLPFPSQNTRAGGFGCLIEGAINDDRPAESLLALLGALTCQPRAFGRAEGLTRFATSQIRMQLRKRREDAA
jgi:hypothetical protein